MVAPPLPAGTRVAGRYRLLEQLGRGAAADVYRALDEKRDRERALKLLDPSEEDVRATSFRHRFAVRVREVGRDRELGRYYVVMDLVRGRSLEQLVRGAVLSPERVVRLASQLAEALDAAHAQGLVHADLTPGKVLVRNPGAPDEELAVLGFPLGVPLGSAVRPQMDRFARQAEALRQKVARRDRRLVTTTRIRPRPPRHTLQRSQGLAYASPEVICGRPFDGAADIYSAGAVIYYALARTPPFQLELDHSDPEQQLRLAIEGREPKRLEALVPRMPPDLAELVARCLAKSPHDRPQSARELRRELRHSLDRAPVSLALPGTPAAELPPPPPADPAEKIRVRLSPGSKLVIRKDDLPARPTLRQRLENPPPPPPLLPSLLLFCSVLLLCLGCNSLLTHVWRSQLHGETVFLPLAEERAPPAWIGSTTSSFPRDLPAGVTWGNEIDTFVLMKDGSELVWIPPTIATIHSKTVHVPGFFMGRYEVTWGQLRRFCNEQEERKLPPLRSAGEAPPQAVYADFPAADVSYVDAAAYAAWAGAALPSEEEWLVAIKGNNPQGGPGHAYPWGGEAPGAEHGNYTPGVPYTWRVGSKLENRSEHGVYDGWRNAAEWLRGGVYLMTCQGKQRAMWSPPEPAPTPTPPPSPASPEGEENASEGEGEESPPSPPEVPVDPLADLPRGFRLVVRVD
ncbi:MAG TPA: hypothetical protein DEA08_10420 [Planctomycetes bacterium]|nr:hypothetical protein [Planctomycetota bacterium]